MDLNSKGQLNFNDISEIGVTFGLVAYFPLDGNIRDYSGYGNNGISSTATVTNGLGQQAYHFDGAGQEIKLPYDATQVTNRNHTVLVWVKVESTLTTSSNDRVSPFKDSGSWAPGLWFHSNTIRGHTDGVYTDVSWTYDNDWHLMGQIYDSATNTLEIVLDGGILSGTPTSYTATTSGEITLGSTVLTGAEIHPLKIFNFRIYNRKLSGKEIEVLYKITNPNNKERVINNNGDIYIKGEISEVSI